VQSRARSDFLVAPFGCGCRDGYSVWLSDGNCANNQVLPGERIAGENAGKCPPKCFEIKEFRESNLSKMRKSQFLAKSSHKTAYQ
jgi:hypothetical protein